MNVNALHEIDETLLALSKSLTLAAARAREESRVLRATTYPVSEVAPPRPWRMEDAHKVPSAGEVRGQMRERDLAEARRLADKATSLTRQAEAARRGELLLDPRDPENLSFKQPGLVAMAMKAGRCVYVSQEPGE